MLILLSRFAVKVNMNDICLWKIYSSRAIEEYQQNILEAEGDIGIVQIIINC